MSYSTITLEGGLFTPDLLDRVSLANGNVLGQNVADFNLAPNRSLLDEIQKSFDYATKRWNNFRERQERSRQNLTSLTRQDWAIPLFEILGFPTLQHQRSNIEVGGSTFPISHLTYDAETAPPIHIVSLQQPLDRRANNTRRSPHALVQEYLNHSESLWGVVTNGAELRLLRDSARLSKPTYLEFNLQAMLEENAYSEFNALYRLCHATRFPQPGVEPHQCLLEKYYNQGIEEGGRVREKLRVGVKDTLETLGAALLDHPGNDALRDAFRTGKLTEDAYYRQLLSLVYRLLFLMVAEERKLLFTEGSDAGLHQVYQRYYSISALRERAERRYANDTHDDLWQGLTTTFRLFRDSMAGGALGLFPVNGELFRETTCQDLETASCANRHFLDALRSLSTFRDEGGVTRRVSYAHLDVEEFGSVYESLLDYRPVVLNRNGTDGNAANRHSTFQLAEGTERKQTGSFYTPPELVRELVESALAPVMEERLAQAKAGKDKEQALLALRVCDPAAGSGHFLLAAARRIARELAHARTGEEEPSPTEYREALRDVVRHCIYAVDKNPLAVDLCKVALWIESHSTGMPLSFLDHHIKCGDSLVGVSDLAVLEKGIPDDAYKAVTGDDKQAATAFRKRNREERIGKTSLFSGPADTGQMGDDWAAFGQLEEGNSAEVQAKEQLYQGLRGPGTDWWQRKVACDLWTYAFFAPLQPAVQGRPDTVPTTDNVRQALANRATQSQLEAAAIDVSQRHFFFHWPLEFPDVLELNGGFDVVLGNPPWEHIKLQEKEFFSTRDAEIANAPNKAARGRLIRALPENNPSLGAEFTKAVHHSEATSRFVRNSQRFPLTGRGDVNTYSIFAETARTIFGPAGRVGMIVPSGIATDDTTKVFFADLVNKHSLVSLYDFENREGVFPGVHKSYKFCLLTMTGQDKPSTQAGFAFFLYRAEQLQDADRRFVLTPEDFALFNPNTRTCPVFRTRRDADIAAKMYRRADVFVREETGGQNQSLGRSVSDNVPHVQRLAPVSDPPTTGGNGLPAANPGGQPAGNPWGVRFQRMFDMSNDSSIFRTWREL